MLLNFNNYSAYIGMSYYSNRLHGKLGGFSSLSNIKRKGLIRIWLSLQLCNISLKNCPHKILDEFLKFYPITDNFTPLQCLCQSAEFKHCLSHRRHLTFLQGSTENAHVLSYFSYNEIFCSCCCCIGAQQGYFTLFPTVPEAQRKSRTTCQVCGELHTRLSMNPDFLPFLRMEEKLRPMCDHQLLQPVPAAPGAERSGRFLPPIQRNCTNKLIKCSYYCWVKALKTHS